MEMDFQKVTCWRQGLIAPTNDTENGPHDDDDRPREPSSSPSSALSSFTALPSSFVDLVMVGSSPLQSSPRPQEQYDFLSLILQIIDSAIALTSTNDDDDDAAMMMEHDLLGEGDHGHAGPHYPTERTIIMVVNDDPSPLYPAVNNHTPSSNQKDHHDDNHHSGGCDHALLSRGITPFMEVLVPRTSTGSARTITTSSSPSGSIVTTTTTTVFYHHGDAEEEEVCGTCNKQ